MTRCAPRPVARRLVHHGDEVCKLHEKQDPTHVRSGKVGKAFAWGRHRIALFVDDAVLVTLVFQKTLDDASGGLVERERRRGGSGQCYGGYHRSRG